MCYGAALLVTRNLRFERMISMADQHVLVVRCLVTPVDFEVQSLWKLASRRLDQPGCKTLGMVESGREG